MKGREKLLAALVLLFLLTSVLGFGQRYYPYVFPEDVCFARNGVAVGSLGDCIEMSSLALAQISEGAADFSNQNGTSDWLLACQRQCRNRDECSFYVLRTPSSSPQELNIQAGPGYACINFK